MHLEEISGNEWRSPPRITSSSTESSKPHNPRTAGRRRVSSRKASTVSPGYAEHIEGLLINAKAQAHSPHSGVAFKAKFEAARLENDKLKEIITDLEVAFEEKVKAAVEHLTTAEVDLRRKVKNLENEVEQKELALTELEYQHNESKLELSVLDALKATIEKLEADKQSLEDANCSMTKRNDVLTELLVISPTKAQQSLDLQSPTRDVSRRTPRPRSMMLPRLLSSPVARYGNRPQSIATSTTTSPKSSNSILAEELETICNKIGPMTDHASAEDLQSIDSGLGESCSTKSTTESSSRRSTLASQPSMSPSSWGLPLPTSPVREDLTIRVQTRRRPRRFMTGSTQLKPLLLPSIAADLSNGQYPSLVPAPLSPGRRYVSDESMDPTVSFLSQAFISPAQSTECTPLWISEEPENFLDDDNDIRKKTPIPGDLSFDTTDLGSPGEPVLSEDDADLGITTELSDHDSAGDEITAFLNVDLQAGSPLTVLEDENSDPAHSFESQECDMLRRLDLELQSSPSPNPMLSTFSPPSFLSCDQLSSTRIPGLDYGEHVSGPREDEPGGSDSPSLASDKHRSVKKSSKRRKTSWSSGEGSRNWSPSSHASETSPLLGRKVLTPKGHRHDHQHQRRTSVDSDLEAQSPKKRKPTLRSLSPLEILQRKDATRRPLVTVTLQTIYGTLSRYTSYIREIKHDPTALARRVIANAWHANWRVLGRLSWWVLGLFVGHTRLKDHQARVWDWEDYDGEGIAERVQHEREADIVMPHGRAEEHVSPTRRVRFDDNPEQYRTRGTKSPARPALKNGKEQKPGWGKSLYLWGKFSVAILLAVGGAVIKGPGEMLKECDDRQDSSSKSPRRARTTGPNDIRTSNAAMSPTRRPLLSPETRLSPNMGTFDFSMDFCAPGNSLDGDTSGLFSHGSQTEDLVVRRKKKRRRPRTQKTDGSPCSLESTESTLETSPEFAVLSTRSEIQPALEKDALVLLTADVNVDLDNTRDEPPMTPTLSNFQPGVPQVLSLIDNDIPSPASAETQEEAVPLLYDPTSPAWPDWPLRQTFLEKRAAHERRVEELRGSLTDLRIDTGDADGGNEVSGAGDGG